MTRPEKRLDPSLLITFAARAAALPPDAWDRIGERCAALDPSTAEAFLGRIELLSRSMTPEADPYKPMPLIRQWFAAVGGLFGLVHEFMRLTRPSPEQFERAAQPDPEGAQRPWFEPGARAMMRIEGLAQRQLARHPGTATALRAVTFGLMWYPKSQPAAFDAIYKPFEPEIPFASLVPGEHAA